MTKAVERVVVDAVDGVVAEEKEVFATWDQLSNPGPPKIVEVHVGGRNLKIKYRSFIPADKMAGIQARGRGDSKKVIADVLREVMIEPAVRTAADARRAMKANSRVIMGIVGEVMDTEAFKQLKVDLGEES